MELKNQETPMKEYVKTEKAPKPVGPYSQAVKAGKFLFVSGQIAIDPKEGKIKADNIEEQTAQIMENIKAIIQTAGYNFNDVVISNVYLSSMALYSEFNSVYAEYFDDALPARVTVGIELMPNALIEISIVAYKE